jgi:hypothetical protein
MGQPAISEIEVHPVGYFRLNRVICVPEACTVKKIPGHDLQPDMLMTSFQGNPLAIHFRWTDLTDSPGIMWNRSGGVADIGYEVSLELEFEQVFDGDIAEFLLNPSELDPGFTIQNSHVRLDVFDVLLNPKYPLRMKDDHFWLRTYIYPLAAMKLSLELADSSGDSLSISGEAIPLPLKESRRTPE